MVRSSKAPLGAAGHARGRSLSHRHRRLQDIFVEACELTPSAARAFVDGACGGDDALASDVRSLLRHHADPEFLEPRTLTLPTPHVAKPLTDRPEEADCELPPERFQLLERLGCGGFGTVYRARDAEQNAIVALKRLHRTDPEDLYRFKHEFRSLAGLTHPHLVKLYELHHRPHSAWFFTMELLDGPTFARFVRDRSDIHECRPDVVARLRFVLEQLVEGLRALHAHGIVHRDLKPSNVIVDHGRRVVVLDFGLARRVGAPRSFSSATILGTPAYMSPEQAHAQGASAASDWYSVGVMLFEALTGRLPFEGDAVDVLLQKCSADAPSPSSMAQGVPEDLDGLTRALLQREPSRRPSGEDLYGLVRRRTTVPVRPPPPATPLLVGRDIELDHLNRVFNASDAGVVVVTGPSGIGKTALVEHFLARIRDRSAEAVVIAGRCHLRASVPYKGFDSLIDELAVFLRSAGRRLAESCIPRDAALLTRLFPVLAQVPGIGETMHTAADVGAEPELRNRAFTVLRELLMRLAERVRLVLFIDDLQWADEDSRLLLESLLQPPPPGLLLIVSCRTDSAAHPTPALLAQLAARTGGVDTIALSPLAERDSLRLTEHLIELSSQSGLSPFAPAVADESGGHPILLHELVKGLLRGTFGGAVAGTAPDVKSLLFERWTMLPERDRDLVELLAVNAQPLSQPLAVQAAGVPPGDMRRIDELVESHLVRVVPTGDGAALEVYHDKVREAILEQLTPRRRQAMHGRLAEILHGRVEPELLVYHQMHAGDTAAAARSALSAAALASRALAFDRAASLYRSSLELGAWSVAERSGISAALAESLANAGRSQEAAVCYSDAAARAASSSRQLDLLRRAGEQYLRCGNVPDGMAAIRAVLGRLGFRFIPQRISLAIAAALVNAWFLRFRGRRFTERAAHELPSDQLILIDTLMTAASGLTFEHPLLALYFQQCALRHALAAGEPERVAYALAYQAYGVFWTGKAGLLRIRATVDHALSLARDIDSPRAVAWAKVMAGIIEFLRGEWRYIVGPVAEAERILRSRCIGVTWELTTAQALLFNALAVQGRWKEVSQRVPDLVREGERRGDLVAAATLPLYAMSYCRRLAQDNPELALAEVERQARKCEWPGARGGTLSEYLSLHAMVECHLYRGDYVTADAVLTSRWRSLPLLSPVTRGVMLFLRGRCALAMARHAPQQRTRGRHVRVARRCAARLARERLEWTTAMAAALRAGIAANDGARSEVIRYLCAAERGFEVCGMEQGVAMARFLRGRLGIADHTGEAAARADDWFTREEVVNPARLVDLYLPADWQRLAR